MGVVVAVALGCGGEEGGDGDGGPGADGSIGGADARVGGAGSGGSSRVDGGGIDEGGAGEGGELAEGGVANEGGVPSEPFCGDGVVNGSEVCDDGDAGDGRGCAADCMSVMPGFVCENSDEGMSVCACVLYVDKNRGDGEADAATGGDSWEEAFRDLAEGLARAEDKVSECGRVEVWVAQGTYVPGDSPESSFRLSDGVLLYGGFAGSETRRDQRDVERHRTVLSGEIETPEGDADNAYHVVVADQGAIGIDGVTIEGGLAEGSEGESNCYGGGMRVTEAELVLGQVWIRSNRSTCNGGGALVSDSEVLMQDVLFEQNSTILGSAGGGLYIVRSTLSLERVVFVDNQALWNGGGMLATRTNGTATDVVFRSNSVDFPEGGMALGGALVLDLSTMRFVNALFHSNRSSHRYGALYLFASSAEFVNTTFYNNDSQYGPVEIHTGFEDAVFINSLVWGRGDGVIPVRIGENTEQFSHCCVEGWAGDGETNLDCASIASPFADEQCHLAPDSVAVDVGDDSAVSEIETDLAGNARIGNDRVDLGAYEFHD